MASWSYESLNLLRQLLRSARFQRHAHRRRICLDPDEASVRRLLKQNGFECTTVTDGRMINAASTGQLGMHSIPDNVLLHNGKVIGTKHVISKVSER